MFLVFSVASHGRENGAHICYPNSTHSCDPHTLTYEGDVEGGGGGLEKMDPFKFGPPEILSLVRPPGPASLGLTSYWS